MKLIPALWTSVFIVISLWSVALGQRQNQTKFPEMLSPGVYVRRLNSPRVYESFAAFTFEFELPSSPSNNTLVFDYDCKNARYNSNYSCPIFYHLHKIRDELRPALEMHHLRHPESASEDSFEIPSCEQILPHFRASTITAEKLRKYQQLLRACAGGLFVKTPLVTRFNQDAPRQSYNDLIKAYIENYYQFLPSDHRQDKSILLNLLTTANALGLTQMLEEAQMWTEVISDCKASSIPAHLLTAEKLKMYLDYLEPKLRAKNLIAVIPPEDISSYYKASLADCVMTKTELLIRILIPVKSRSTDWNLHAITPVPFVYNDGEDGSQLLCTLKNINHDTVYSYESKSNLSYPATSSCNPQNSVVCHTGEDNLSMNQFKKSCVSEIFEGDKKQMMKSCDLHCEPIESFRTPIIFRVASDTFYFAGKVNESIQIQCQNITKQLTPAKEGSLEIQLPCQCSILNGNKRFVIQEPCGKNVTISNMKPLHLAPVTETPEQPAKPSTTPVTEFDEDSSFETFVYPRSRSTKLWK